MTTFTCNDGFVEHYDATKLRKSFVRSTSCINRIHHAREELLSGKPVLLVDDDGDGAPDMLERGVKVTVNSDDPAYFGGYLNQNFIELADALDLNETDIRTLCKNSFKASFLSEEEKAKRYAEIDGIHV